MINLFKYFLILNLLLNVFIDNAWGQYFNNVNHELCYELYEVIGPPSPYRVYIVIDQETFTPNDSLILNRWPNLSQIERQSITQEWSVDGRRIESEFSPYISHPPIFTKKNIMKPEKIVQQMNWENTPWFKAKEYWAYPDRPF